MPVEPLETDPNTRIYKYELDMTAHQVIKIRSDEPCVDVLHVAVQDEKICIWSQVDLEAEEREIQFFVVGTGHPLPLDADTYIGTAHDGAFVWHIYIAHDFEHGEADDE